MKLKKVILIKMSESESVKVNITSRSTHHGPEKSSTLNRRYVKRPTITHITINDDSTKNNSETKPEATNANVKAKTKIVINSSEDKNEIKAEHKLEPITLTQPKTEKVNLTEVNKSIEKSKVALRIETEDLPPAKNPFEDAINARKVQHENNVDIATISAKALKDAEIKKALKSMKKAEPEEQPKQKISKHTLEKAIKKESKFEEVSLAKPMKRAGRTKRILLAFACSAAVIAGLGYIVRINLPDVSIKVAAMQTGINATYPSYVPRDYSLTGVYTDSDTVIIDFTGPNKSSCKWAG